MNYNQGNSDRSTVKVVVKALRALDFLMVTALERPGASLGEVAEAVGIRSTTARNILKTMEACGYVARIENRLYCPGARCADLARATVAGRLLTVGRELIGRLSQQTGESIVLTTLVGGDRKVLLRAAGRNVVCVNSELVEGRQFYGLVTGRVMLAFASSAERDGVLVRQGMPGEAWDGLDNAEAIRMELDAIRKAGFAEDRPTPELVALAVPVLDHGNHLLGAIGLHVPAFRYAPGRRESLLASLDETSKVLSSLVIQDTGAEK